MMKDGYIGSQQSQRQPTQHDSPRGQHQLARSYTLQICIQDTAPPKSHEHILLCIPLETCSSAKPQGQSQINFSDKTNECVILTYLKHKIPRLYPHLLGFSKLVTSGKIVIHRFTQNVHKIALTKLDLKKVFALTESNANFNIIVEKRSQQKDSLLTPSTACTSQIEGFFHSQSPLKKVDHKEESPIPLCIIFYQKFNYNNMLSLLSLNCITSVLIISKDYITKRCNTFSFIQ